MASVKDRTATLRKDNQPSTPLATDATQVKDETPKGLSASGSGNSRNGYPWAMLGLTPASSTGRSKKEGDFDSAGLDLESPRRRLDTDMSPMIGKQNGSFTTPLPGWVTSFSKSLAGTPLTPSRLPRKPTIVTKVVALVGLAALGLVFCLLLLRAGADLSYASTRPSGSYKQSRRESGSFALAPVSEGLLALALNPSNGSEPLDASEQRTSSVGGDTNGGQMHGRAHGKNHDTRIGSDATAAGLRDADRRSKGSEGGGGQEAETAGPKSVRTDQDSKADRKGRRGKSEEEVQGTDVGEVQKTSSSLLAMLLGGKGKGHKKGKVRFATKMRGCPSLPKKTKGNDPLRHYPSPEAYDRTECRCTPVNNFVVLSMQRSGSGWFETFLNSHPNISSFGEVFGKSRGRKANLSHIIETLDKVYNLDWNNSAAKNSCTSAAGFKWMLNQGAMSHHQAITEYFVRNHVSVIMLVRRNVLRRLVSILANAYDRKMKLLNGQHKSHVHTEEEAVKLAEFRPRLGVKHLIGNLQRVQQIVDDAIQAFNRTRMKIVAYEEVVRNASVLRDVQQFLGVPVEPLFSQQVKIHKKPLRDTIENYEEVAKKLKGTDLEFVLNDDYA